MQVRGILCGLMLTTVVAACVVVLQESISRHKLWTHGGETTPSSDGSEQGARLVKRDSSRGSSMNGRAFHHAGSLSLNGHANLPTNYAAAASTGH